MKENSLNYTSDIHYAMSTFINQYPKFHNQLITPSFLSDGFVFATILNTVKNFDINPQKFKDIKNKWPIKVGNLKMLIQQIEQFFQNKLEKGIKTRDIDLIKIAKDNNLDEISKLFEIVMALLMQSENKEDYIQLIMNSDQKTQSAFVSIIQNGMESRAMTIEEVKQTKTAKILEQYQIQNIYLRQQICDLLTTNSSLQQQIKGLKLHVEYFEQQNEKKTHDIDHKIHAEPNQHQHLKNMVQNMKEKLIQAGVEHETQLSRLRQQINILQNKNEQIRNDYKQNCQILASKSKQKQSSEKQRIRLTKNLQQKELTIKKLQQRNQQLIRKNYSMQQKQIYLNVELQKRQIRFKQLEKEIKNRFSGGSMHQSKQLFIEFNNNQSKEEIQNIRVQLERTQLRVKQLEKQNKIAMKKNQKLIVVQNQKKKVQSAMIELDKTLKNQIQILMISLYQFREENVKMSQQLREYKNRVLS